MEWFTVNGIKYDQEQLEELATTLNITATKLASLSTTECIKFLSNIPYYKPSDGNTGKESSENITGRSRRTIENDKLTVDGYVDENLHGYNNYTYDNKNKSSLDNPRFAWTFAKKCANKCQRIRYKGVLFFKRGDKISPKTLKSVEQDSRYPGISYEELISPYSEKPDQPYQINLDLFLNYEFKITNPEYDSNAINSIKNTLSGRQSNESSSNVLYKEYKSMLNTAFSKSRGFLAPSMTFTKLYNLREKMFKLIEVIPALDPATVAAGWVLFERLVTSNYVIASNRKLYAGVCLIISFKFYQDDTLNILGSLTNALQSMDSHSNMTARNIFSLELHIFTLLRFDLALNFSQVSSHLNHYLSSKNMTFNEFYRSNSPS